MLAAVVIYFSTVIICCYADLLTGGQIWKTGVVQDTHHFQVSITVCIGIVLQNRFTCRYKKTDLRVTSNDGCIKCLNSIKLRSWLIHQKHIAKNSIFGFMHDKSPVFTKSLPYLLQSELEGELLLLVS